MLCAHVTVGPPLTLCFPSLFHAVKQHLEQQRGLQNTLSQWFHTVRIPPEGCLSLLLEPDFFFVEALPLPQEFTARWHHAPHSYASRCSLALLYMAGWEIIVCMRLCFCVQMVLWWIQCQLILKVCNLLRNHTLVRESRCWWRALYCITASYVTNDNTLR